MTQSITWVRGALAMVLVTLVAACVSVTQPPPELEGFQDELVRAEILLTGYNRVATDIIEMDVLRPDERYEIVLIAEESHEAVAFAREMVDAYEAGDETYDFTLEAVTYLLEVLSQYGVIVGILASENTGSA